MMSRRFGVSTAAGAVAAMLLMPAAALSSHVAGATYTGTIEGGGTVEVDISADGSSVTRFAVTDLPTTTTQGGQCPALTTTAFTGSVPSMELSADPPRHFFSTMAGPTEGMGGPLEFDVYDDRPNEISGRLAYSENGCGNVDPRGGFPGQNVSWNAMTGGGCFNSDAYLTAKANLESATTNEAALAAKFKKLTERMKRARAKGNVKAANRAKKARRTVAPLWKEAPRSEGGRRVRVSVRVPVTS